MTGNATLDGIIAALGALATAWGLWAGGRKALADAGALKMPPATPYEALAARVTALESADAEKGQEISRLRSPVRRLAGVLTRERQAAPNSHDDGAEPPPPDREVERIRSVIHDINRDEQAS